jgi:predicted ribosomally synthesized peptide with SipW-like signal peptide
MDEHVLTRRKLLGGLGTVGVAAGLTGAGTTAYFSDEETFEDNQLVAGELDLKVGWQEVYSDWSSDETQGISFEMVDGDVLPSGTVGFPSFDPMVAVPTGDVETFLANAAVEAFPDSSDSSVQDVVASADVCDAYADTPEDLDPQTGDRTYNDDTYDGAVKPLLAIENVLPGDFGQLTFDLQLCGSPGYLWLSGDLADTDENGTNEPESKAGGEGPDVEALDAVQVGLFYDAGVSGQYEASSDVTVLQTSLRGFTDNLTLNAGRGIPLNGDPSTGFSELGDPEASSAREPFAADTRHRLTLEWWVPSSIENELQTDGVALDLGFYVEQARHNDGSGSA